MTEAQQLAEWLDIFSHQTMHPLPITKAAAELRRLEAECEQLHFELELCGQLKRGYQEQAAQALAECEQLRVDAARYGYLRRKVCFTGNGDGTSSMHAINLPDARGFPKQGEELAFIDAAIDEAMSRGETK